MPINITILQGDRKHTTILVNYDGENVAINMDIYTKNPEVTAALESLFNGERLLRRLVVDKLMELDNAIADMARGQHEEEDEDANS